MTNPAEDQTPETSDLPSDAQPAPTDASGPHGPDCTCERTHHANVWPLLDVAFPNDPHLWRAAEQLFLLSTLNPADVTASDRTAVIEGAQRHLQRAETLTASSTVSPTDAIVERFRSQLDGI